MARNNLEERLIDYGVLILQVIKKLPSTIEGKHMASQLARSGTSPALNYGEAQSAESRKDFIHKLGIVLKELRESHISLKIIHKSNLIENDPQVIFGIKESDELVAIFITCIATARKNLSKENPRFSSL